MKMKIFNCQLSLIKCQLILAILFTACSVDDESGQKGSLDSAVRINGGIPTKAVDTDWDSGDAIGVTMYTADYSQQINGVYNTQYITDDSGTVGEFTAANEDEILYFPQNGDAIRLNAYYPYQADLAPTMLLPWSVTDQSELRVIDLMTAEHQTGFDKTDTDVTMHFYHRLCKLIFILSVQDDDNFVTLEDCELTIRNVATGNTYDLLNDNFTDANPDTGNIAVPLRDDEEGNYRQAIIFPRDAADGVVFEFLTPSGDTYIANMSEDLALEGGNQYTFLLTFEKNPITVSATIEPWNVQDPITFETLLVSTPAGESSGVTIGDEMNVYLQDTESGDFELLRTFTYQSVNNWVASTPVYWEDIEQDPATFRASIIAAEPLNDTQLSDILIADELEVARNTGADFTLRHAASKVMVSLISDTFTADELNDATIILPNYLTGGTEQNGAFVPGTTRADIDVDRTDPAASTAIFQPQTVAASDPMLSITIAGRTYDVEQDEDFTYDAGVAYQIIVNVRKEALTVSVTIVDWDEQTIELTAVTVGTAVSGSEGVLNGEELEVYTGDATSRSLLNTYRYYAAEDTFRSPTPIYWESLADPTTFYGAIKREDKYNDTQLDDYLLGDPVTMAASNGVHFDLTHAASQIIVQLTSEDGTFSTTELAAMNLVLPNYLTSATVNNGVFVPGTTRGNITVAKNVGENDDSAIAIIQPQDIPAGTTVINVVSNNRTYSATYGSAIEFAQNMSTTLIIDLSKTEVTFSATVTDWIDNPDIEMVAPAITIGGTLNDTDDFFQDETIYVYKLIPSLQTLLYSYQDSGDGYEWEGPTLYWDDQPNLAFRATAIWYPTTEPDFTGTSFPWEIGADQTESANNYYDNYDLLTSHVNLTSPQYVNFNFTHATALVEVNLIAGTGFVQSELDNAEVVLTDYALTGTMNINTGVFGSVTGVDDVNPKVITDGIKYEALVMPQDKAAGESILTVTIQGYPDHPFTAIYNQPLSFQAGRRTILNVTLNKTEIVLSATLADWVNGQTGNIVIQ